jgi:hypothetical protein
VLVLEDVDVLLLLEVEEDVLELVLLLEVEDDDVLLLLDVEEDVLLLLLVDVLVLGVPPPGRFLSFTFL